VGVVWVRVWVGTPPQPRGPRVPIHDVEVIAGVHKVGFACQTNQHTPLHARGAVPHARAVGSQMFS
jgi:hypothetical protein